MGLYYWIGFNLYYELDLSNIIDFGLIFIYRRWCILYYGLEFILYYRLWSIIYHELGLNFNYRFGSNVI